MLFTFFPKTAIILSKQLFPPERCFQINYYLMPVIPVYEERIPNMRIWFKIFKENRLIKDLTIENYGSDTRTHKIFDALEQCCLEMDLSKPIWLDSTVREFKRHSKARFTSDAFVDEIEFDYLEIHVIEED